MITRYGLFALGLIAIVAMAVAMNGSHQNPYWQEADHSKYLKFTHVFHATEQGIECDQCHYNVSQSTKSSDRLIGDHQSCQACHDDQISSDCGFCHVDTANIIPIPPPQREIIFSHELHTSKDSIACTTCHISIDSVTLASSANMPMMSTCINCHSTASVSTECSTCHTNFAQLIPADHLVGEFKRDHRRVTRLDGDMAVSCATCHTESFCQDCHTGTELHGFGSYKDLMADPYPRTPLRDAPKELKLQEVHDLNYRFTHGIDAKSKRLDCASCHDEQTFCVECHQAGGNINQGKFIPETHSQPGFVTIGRGSGGGLHAELARRDLESCVACHDVQGNDPICLRCHTEGGGVR
jgi:hypothetical protein